MRAESLDSALFAARIHSHSRFRRLRVRLTNARNSQRREHRHGPSARAVLQILQFFGAISDHRPKKSNPARQTMRSS
jgi:hypothetical protein